MQTEKALYRTPAAEVHDVLKRYMLVDGFPMVFDFEKSHGSWLHDAASGRDYLDLFAFFASQSVGYGHPRLTDASFVEKLGRLAVYKPANSDVYTQAMADFVATFGETVVPESHRKHLFFVEGGALAVENAMKTAFDWKYRKNRERGGPDTENLQILHFEDAFHGRSGYTLSVTNTDDPNKYQYFPRFDWPRVTPPACRFPQDDANVAAVEAAEARTLEQIRRAFDERENLIAAILIETIQGEGGDHHFRRGFLQALRDICDEKEALLIFDEVQCGMGLTGEWWAWQDFGVVPDVFCFGKKSQVCGIAANDRIDDVDSVFKVSSRINSTWGGNLIDMVRSEMLVRIVADENLLANARDVGAYALDRLRATAADTGKIDNVRGRGLMIAFDLPTADERNRVRGKLFEEGAIILPCGARSLRFRPVLDIDRQTVDEAIKRITAALG